MVRFASVATATRRAWLFIIIGTVTACAALFLELADSVRESELVVRLDEHALTFVTRHVLSGWLLAVGWLLTLVGARLVFADLRDSCDEAR